jgi:hypothetical protein
MSYESYKRDLAVRILRQLGYDLRPNHTAIESVMIALDEFLPSDDSVNRGTTKFTDLVPVYEVDCPCAAKPEYTDVHPFCPECGCSFN